MTEHEIDDETRRYAPPPPPPPPAPTLSAPVAPSASDRQRGPRIAIRVAVALAVVFATFGFNGGWFSSSTQQTPNIDVSALNRDIASQLPRELAVTRRIPPTGCLDHFLSDPKVKAVPCDQPHLSELIGPESTTAAAGSECDDAERLALGPDVVDLKNAGLVSEGEQPWGPDHAVCSLRLDFPMTGTAQTLAPLITEKAVTGLEPGTCLPVATTDARPMDCSQPHQAEVVSGPVLRPDGATVGDVCRPSLRAYLAPGRIGPTDKIEFVFHKETPNVGRCVVEFASPRAGLQRR